VKKKLHAATLLTIINMIIELDKRMRLGIRRNCIDCSWRAWVAGLAACLWATLGVASAESVTIGTTKTVGFGPLFIADAKGYFTAEGLDAKLIYFTSGTPIPVGIVSGDLDYGGTGTSGPLFNLGGQGAIKIIAGNPREAATFHDFAIVASKRAYEAGLTSPKDIAGHSFAVAQVGSPAHYGLALIAEKFGFDLKSVRVVQMQGIANAVSAMAGGQTDAGLAPVPAITPPLQSGEVKLLAWAGDTIPWQLGMMITGTKTADEKHDQVERFLRAYRNGAKDYFDAFAAADGTRKDGPTAAATLAILSKYLDLPPAILSQGLAYIDPEGRLDVNDVLHQIAWFKAEGLTKEDVDGRNIIDTRYAIPLH
jgi:NitT/TauT family transport system substrate-binding protein